MRGPIQLYMSFEQLLIALGKVHGWKAISSILISWIGINLMPVASFLAVGIVLVISDWITGISAANKRGDKITSRGLYRSVQKVVFYSLAIMLVVSVEKRTYKGNMGGILRRCTSSKRKNG